MPLRQLPNRTLCTTTLPNLVIISRARFQPECFPFRPYEYQLDGIRFALNGYGVQITMGTGPGKSLASSFIMSFFVLETLVINGDTYLEVDEVTSFIGGGEASAHHLCRLAPAVHDYRAEITLNTIHRFHSCYGHVMHRRCYEHRVQEFRPRSRTF